MRILFISATRIGDAVLSTGLLRHLLQQNPGAKVTVACGPVAAPLFKGVPGLQRILVLKKKKWSMHWFSFWTSTVSHYWDWVIDLRNAPLSYLLASKNTRHLGQTGRDKEDEHRVVRFARLLGLQDTPPSPTLWTLPEHAQKAKELIPDGSPVLALGPTANWGPKRWLPENFVELAKRLTADDGILPGARIAVFAAESEGHLAEPVLQGLPQDRTINLVGGPGLLEIYACFKRCALYIGNDSGLSHMAAAADIPVLGLFGPTKPHLYRPWGEKTAIATTGIPFQDHFKNGNEWLEEKSLMELLTVEKAEAAAIDLWQKAGESQ